eukprot:TRINITY_DN240_c0_g1_i1.p1 TRINITY_DN240_c0_g1~~TRINITY_DN240_c0_g1_i1.p1  ORF type:complete len:229 (-),score=67.34 TRINITY_DN240_c0_g1_i1:34-720(-)
MNTFTLLALFSIFACVFAGDQYIAGSAYVADVCGDATTIFLTEYIQVGACLYNTTVSFDEEASLVVVDEFDNDKCSGTATQTFTRPLKTCIVEGAQAYYLTLLDVLPPLPASSFTEAMWEGTSCTAGSEVTVVQYTSNCVYNNYTNTSEYYDCVNGIPTAFVCSDDECKQNCQSTVEPVVNCVQVPGTNYSASLFCSQPSSPSIIISEPKVISRPSSESKGLRNLMKM